MNFWEAVNKLLGKLESEKSLKQIKAEEDYFYPETLRGQKERP